ncbi:MAG: ABC transporter ATP-binding protein [Lachnospiraceae bacterium]|nr:ABC transporter ATP-binding protein [Lachnospiraceae bacterium]MBO7362693.1 ABC transporter ATP-binding protein [Lachnospiraceae bacterium]MBP5471046.1 ABC transporter ATP-binding protein [Lachnospiraceae bacterium]MBP5701578.1 ABC transporter ATP-binding protein [Lachnospiraceae bacterium]MBP5762466.1 ABC transporter ATP-binding protein [Lachnospiraceae bacterium]
MARNKINEDEYLEESFDLEQLKRLGKYVGAFKGKLSLAVGIMIVSSGLSMLIPIFMKNVMDIVTESNFGNGLGENEAIQKIIFYSVLTFVITVVCALITRAKIKLTSQVGQGVIYNLRRELFIHLQELPFSYFDDKPHGKIQVRVVNYVNNLSDLLSNGIVNTITDIFSMIFIVVYMLYLDVRFTLIVLCGMPVLVFIIVFIKSRQHKAWQIQSNKQSNLNAYIAESVNGIRVTQSFVREEYNTDYFNTLNKEAQKSWLTAVKYNFILWPVINNINVISASVIYVLGIGWLARGNVTITAGLLIAFAGYASRFWQPIMTLANFYNSLLTAVSYLERIFETIDAPVLVKDKEGAGQMPAIKGEVEYKDVKFAYEDGVEVLHGVSFKVKPGESYAIVGPTGAGKTTIVNLISRFYNVTSGQILIDGINIEDVTIKSLRTQMGVMMQDSFIFSGTIMDNIRYGNKDASDEDVIKAAKTVRAHDFIMSLEKGYDTEVNERGSRLSAGQRQLISFARAVLADPKILILDEATAAIDTETEILLQEGLARMLKGRTSFIIAHRLSTIRNADCIMYVDHGMIEEKGTHEELMKIENGNYRRLCESQLEAFS